MTEYLLQIEDLHTCFQTRNGIVHVLRGLSLNVPRGQVVGIVGESGSGKTVTALSIMRLIRPPGRILSGRILFQGTDLLRLSEQQMERVRGRQIAMIFQQPRESLNPVLTVETQIRLVLRQHLGLDGHAALTRARHLLRQVELPDVDRLLRAYPHELSGGMCQRVMIALCLACSPKLLIADEATTALDVTVQLQILRLLRQLREELGLTLVVITHNLGVVAELCQWVAVMYAGELVEFAPAEQFFRAPFHPYAARLLACRPAISLEDDLPVIPGVVPDLLTRPSGCPFHPRCHRARPRCRLEHPSLEERLPGHEVRCFFPEEVPAWTPSLR
ncbi:MAG: ABC transporter ATP-binding protein [Armatimonadota bacterium]|nr:ABC transporter ATP-binding protein [Armatimonadota bacterium]